MTPPECEPVLGWPDSTGKPRPAFQPGGSRDDASLAAALAEIHAPILLENVPAGLRITRLPCGAGLDLDRVARGAALVPACPVENLGDADFLRDHGLRYPHVTGSMANGIASCEIVEAMAEEGMLGFFGAAGLPLSMVEAAIVRLQSNLLGRPWGVNLIHTPSEPALESRIVDLFVERGVKLVEASAFLDLTLDLVRYRVDGIAVDQSGEIVTPNRVIAKVSRIEVASKFFAPPPGEMLAELVRRQAITPQQAQLASRIPVAQDLTAEADSGGHTDNRPAITLVPTLIALCERQQARLGFTQRLRVGAAGGIATPWSASAAFALGASYILTGSINQSCVESGTSDAVRGLLAAAKQADVIMAPAPDMFEMGVKVQVLKRGTMFAMRATRLYEIYRGNDSIDDIPAAAREHLEKTLFRTSLEQVWMETREYFLERDPRQVERAEADPKHRLALVCRWYLGLASRWARDGIEDRRVDYQIWCGPSMGAFNEWTRGSILEDPAERRVVSVALNILHGAAILERLRSARIQGIAAPAASGSLKPLSLEEVRARLEARLCEAEV